VWRGAGRGAARVLRRVTECDGQGCTSWPWRADGKGLCADPAGGCPEGPLIISLRYW